MFTVKLYLNSVRACGHSSMNVHYHDTPYSTVCVYVLLEKPLEKERKRRRVEDNMEKMEHSNPLFFTLIYL